MRTILISFILIFISQVLEAQTVKSRTIQGNQFYLQNRFDLAENEYRAALQLDPKNVTARFNLANALQKQGKFNEALKILDELTATIKDKNLKSTTYYNQGVAHTKLKSLEPSIESYKNALRINPDDKEARENLQKALREQKKNQSQSQSEKKPQPSMSQKEAEQKLKQLQEKEKQLQEKMQKRNKQGGSRQAQDW